jgi:hypothetical protein
MYYRQPPFYFRNEDEMDILPCVSNANNMENMNPTNVSPESMMPEYQLETMYPKIYYIIYPHVIYHCDLFDKNCCCNMMMPTSEDLRRMSEDISMRVESEVEDSIKQGMRESEERQLGFQGRGVLRDLVRILLLREFFQRRHRPHRPHHHMGY